ncbi:hypothetical protein PSTG_19462, partial [Puccinia striiformis f. sp. tritici PST-78]
VRPPPPPAIFDPKELFSKRSAHLAFEKNLLRERWSRLYQEAIRLRTGETVQQSTGRLEALVKTIDDWKKLDSDHLLTRRIEVMQALIAQIHRRRSRRKSWRSSAVFTIAIRSTSSCWSTYKWPIRRKCLKCPLDSPTEFSATWNKTSMLESGE